MAKQIDFINIDDMSGDYYNTRKQIEILRDRSFKDKFAPSVLPASTVALGLLSEPPIITAGSGSSHDYLVSGSMDTYRNGVEITTPAQWAVGTFKISAGTPGHIIAPICNGVNDVNTLRPDAFFKEIENFNPVTFIEIQNGASTPEEVYTFPIITSDADQAENYFLNGIIEPFPLRSVVSFFSINTPFEPQGVRGGFGNGNEDNRRATSQVLSVDDYDPAHGSVSHFLDQGESLEISQDGSTVVLGPTIGYVNIDNNTVVAFADEWSPRGCRVTSTYTSDMIEALFHLSSSTATYITEKQRSAPTGFMYDNVYPAGTDSIAFGGMTY